MFRPKFVLRFSVLPLLIWLNLTGSSLALFPHRINGSFVLDNSSNAFHKVVDAFTMETMFALNLLNQTLNDGSGRLSQLAQFAKLPMNLAGLAPKFGPLNGWNQKLNRFFSNALPNRDQQQPGESTNRPANQQGIFPLPGQNWFQTFLKWLEEKKNVRKRFTLFPQGSTSSFQAQTRTTANPATISSSTSKGTPGKKPSASASVSTGFTLPDVTFNLPNISASVDINP